MSRVVGFVTHCGPKVGLGHLRRCLTLAQALKDQGAEVEFILGHDPHGLATTRGHGFSARAVLIHHGREVFNALRAARPAVVVADSYDLAAPDFQALGQIAPVVALDDLADRALPVALLWNGGIQAERIDYGPHVLPHTRLLLGPQYALLAPEYRRLPARILRDTVERVLVTVGGADPGGALEPLFHAARRGCPTAKMDVVLGPYVPPPTRVNEDDVVIHRAIPSLFPILQKIDLAVSAGGQTTYELAATGTPAVVIWIADNQRPQVLEFERRGTLSVAGGVGEGALAEDRISSLVRALASDAEARRIMSRAGQACLDGEGAARTAAAVLSL